MDYKEVADILGNGAFGLTRTLESRIKEETLTNMAKGINSVQCPLYNKGLS